MASTAAKGYGIRDSTICASGPAGGVEMKAAALFLSFRPIVEYGQHLDKRMLMHNNMHRVIHWTGKQI